MNRSKNRWAGLCVLLQVVLLFFVEDLGHGRAITIVPMLLVAFTAILNLEAWVKGKGWH